MQAKTIQAILKKKIEAWTKTITDERVRKLAQKNTIVTGGAIASMLLGEAVNDYDIYFRNHETTLAIAYYYVSKFKAKSSAKFKEQNKDVRMEVHDKEGRIKIVVQSAGIAAEGKTTGYQYFEQIDPKAGAAGEYVEEMANAAESAEDSKGEKYRPIFLSANAITLANKVQLVIRFYGEPDQIHENYDFSHVTNYWTSWDNELVLRKEALQALLEKRLNYQGSLYPICSIIRTRKFVKRGWYISAGNFLKMCLQVSELDLTDVNVLEEQLTGVDTAYFMELIGALRDHMKKTGSDKVDRTYIMEVIDRIF